MDHAARWMDERLGGLWAQLGVPLSRVRLEAIPDREWQGTQWEMRVLDVRLPREVSLIRASQGMERIAQGTERRVQVFWVDEGDIHRAADIWVEGYLTHRVFLKEASEETARPPAFAPSAGPRIALIVDDLGQAYEPARSLLALNVPLTFSLLPRLSQTRRIAREAGERGVEVMLHVPMEPWGYPDKRPGPGSLMAAMALDDVEAGLVALVRGLPEAKGANNHMGSRLTEDRERMGKVMEVLGSRGLYFVDSLTSPRSVGFHVAREKGVAAYRRDVFLDPVQDEEKIRGQFRRLLQVARLQGHAIGICHPYPETLRLLPELVDRSRAEGYQWVTVSQLLGDGRRTQQARAR